MEKKPDIKIMDTSGKDSIKCPNCGLVSKLTPRTISMETLGHMQDVQRFLEWEKRNRVHSQGFGNVRIVICPQCQQIMLCKDQFTTEKKE